MADKQSAAFGFYPHLNRHRAFQDREAAKDMDVAMLRGFVSGVAGMPGDLESIGRLLLNIQGPERFVMPRSKEEGMAMLGQIFGANRVSLDTVLPTSEDIEARLPLKEVSETPVGRAVTGASQLAGGFYTGPGSAVRLATGIPKAVVRAGKDFARAAGQTVSPLTVYHGSPHRFPPTAKNPLGEFDRTKIGTGEGAQAYGYGHYVAEAPGVAKSYQPRSPEYEQKLLEKYNRAQARRDYPTMEILEDAMLHKTPDEIIQRFTNAEDGYTPAHAKAARDFVNWYGKNPPEVGALYKVDLSDEKIARMLDYDKPLSQQTKEVQEFFEPIVAPRRATEAQSSGPEWGDLSKPRAYDPKGSELMSLLGSGDPMTAESVLSGGTGGQRSAAQLQAAGIPGVRYLDEGSRGGGQGTSNFVVFPGEEEALNILERKKAGGAVGMAGGGALVKAVRAAQAVGRQAPAVVIPSAVSRVQEAVRQSKGDFGARRVQRAADEIPNLERMYKEEGLRFAFTGDNAQAMMTMNPADFEKFALRLEGRTDIGPKMRKLAEEGQIDKYTLPTDEYIEYLQKLRGGFEEPAFLSINKQEQGLPLKPFISGHEGRHRSRALAASGQPTSLVRLIPRAELREPFPRRSQDEYLEALRQELDLTGNLVVPEGGGSPVILPDIYAKGGRVHVSSNPDTMRMELNERRMGAGGFLAKAVKGAQKVLPAAEREANLAKFVEPSAIKQRMYHGSPKSTIDELKTGLTQLSENKPDTKFMPWTTEKSRDAVFLTPDPQFANKFVGDPRAGAEPTVYPVFVQVQRPWDYENPKHIKEAINLHRKKYPITSPDVTSERLAEKYETFDNETRQRIFENLLKGLAKNEKNWGDIETADLQNIIRELGYDAFYTQESGRKNLGVFDPSKIKSATGNRGTYDVTDPDINKAAGGAISADDLTIEERPL